MKPARDAHRPALSGAILVALLGITLCTRFVGLSQGLPDVIHPDEKVIIHHALYFGTGDLNPHFFLYPSFSMYATSVWIGGEVLWLRLSGKIHSLGEAKTLFIKDPTAFYFAGRIGAATSGALVVLSLFVWGKRFLGILPSAAAATLAAINPQLIQQGHVDKPDSLMTFLGLVCFLTACESWRRNSQRALCLSAVLGGLAVSTKYNALPFLFPVGIVGLLLVWQQGMAKGGRLLLLLPLAALLGFVMGTPFALLDFHSFYAQFADQIQVVSTGLPGLVAHGVFYNLRNLIAGITTDRGSSWALAALFLFAFPFQNGFQRIASLCVILFYGMVAPRALAFEWYVTPALPLLFFASVALPAQKKGAFLIMSLLLGWGCLGSARTSIRLIHSFCQTESRQAAKIWILANVPDGTKVVTDAGGPELPMDQEELKDLLAKARASHHPKATLFALQLDHYDPSEKHFNVYLSKQALILTAPKFLETSQKIQRLASIESGVPALLNQGFRYVIVAEAEERLYKPGESAGDRYPRFREFYASLDQNPHAQQVYATPNTNVGGKIRVYRLEP